MIELVALGAQADLEIPQAATAGDLSEGHAEELIEAGEGADPAVAAIALNTAMERVERQVVHHLGEDELS